MSTPSPRMAALIAGTGYLVMAVIAMPSLFEAPQVTAFLPGGPDGAPWPETVTSGTLKLTTGLGIVIVLDIIVAWALYHLFRQDSARIALWMMITRVAYALLFAFALMYAMNAREIVQDSPFDAAHINEVASLLDRFQHGWDFAFFLFSAHLVLLSALVWSASLWRRGLAVLLVIAALGYFADSVIVFTLPDITFRFAPFTFVGELALIVWLFVTAAYGLSPREGSGSGKR